MLQYAVDRLKMPIIHLFCPALLEERNLVRLRKNEYALRTYACTLY
jgi:hypothetical protein